MLQSDRWELDSSLGEDLASTSASYPVDADGKEIPPSDPNFHRAAWSDLHNHLNRFIDSSPDTSNPGGSGSTGMPTLHAPVRRRSRYDNDDRVDDTPIGPAISDPSHFEGTAGNARELHDPPASQVIPPQLTARRPTDDIQVESFDLTDDPDSKNSMSVDTTSAARSTTVRRYGSSRQESKNH